MLFVCEFSIEDMQYLLYRNPIVEEAMLSRSDIKNLKGCFKRRMRWEEARFTEFLNAKRSRRPNEDPSSYEDLSMRSGEDFGQLGHIGPYGAQNGARNQDTVGSHEGSTTVLTEHEEPTDDKDSQRSVGPNVDVTGYDDLSMRTGEDFGQLGPIGPFGAQNGARNQDTMESHDG